MKTDTEKIPQSAEEMLNELRSLLAEAQKIVEQSPGGGCEAAWAEMRQRFEAARKRLGEFCEVTRDKITQGAKTTDAAIRENPYAALAIAAGVGVLVGVLLVRRSPSNST
jgi:ElaB/YqjD/DUF883 family membrane-anchored ribosome-binding protein